MGLLYTNKKEVIIYGINMQAEQLKYYLEMEKIEVAAFCVDKDYYKESTLQNRPVVYFEEIEKYYSPDKYAMILSFGYKNMVANREEKYVCARDKKYDMATFISDDAKVYTQNVAENVIVYPNTVIAPYVRIDKGCFFETSCTIAHHCEIGKFNFFAPGVTVGGAALVENNCFFGVSSVIASGKKIANRTLIGAGVCITRDTHENEALRHSECVKLSHQPEYYI